MQTTKTQAQLDRESAKAFQAQKDAVAAENQATSAAYASGAKGRKIDAPRPATKSADFRTEAETLTWHRGELFYICVCYEYIEGRWEGFVSMRRPAGEIPAGLVATGAR